MEIKLVTLERDVYKRQTLKATVTGADAPKVTFTSSNPKVAVVNKTTGKVTAKAKGSAVITVKCGDVKVTCYVRPVKRLRRAVP